MKEKKQIDNKSHINKYNINNLINKTHNIINKIHNIVNKTHNIIHKESWILLIIIFLIVGISSNYLSNAKAQENNYENITLENSSLIVFYTNNTFVNETIYFYAIYKDYNETLINGSCVLSINSYDNNSYDNNDSNNNNNSNNNYSNIILSNNMVFNHSSYYLEKVFNENNIYNFSINCSSEEFIPKYYNYYIIINLSKYLNQNEINNTNDNTNNNSYNNSSNNINNNTNTSNSTIIDLDNDGFNNEIDCDDNDTFINPNAKEILYNNKDDDCNPNTFDYLFLNLNTEKELYNISQNVKITINANNYSDTYLTINTPTNISYVYIYSNKTYPITQDFSLTSLSGKYTIEAISYYDNYSIQKNTSFNVSSNFNVEIYVNQTEAFENEIIRFKAIITGNNGNVNMIWNMDNNNEMYQAEFDYNYSNPGIYNVVLIATDQTNQIVVTKQIIINKKYFLKVKVVNNSSNEIITNATIKLDSISKKVNSTGEYEFSITNKTYNLEVSADNYYSYEDEIKINNSLIFTVKLVKNLESIAPEIFLISPENNTLISDPKNIDFKFKFLDNSKAECNLLISDLNNWWSKVYQANDLEPDKDYIIKINLYNETDIKEEDLSNDTKIYWKILCVDEDENSVYSDYYEIYLNKNENKQNYNNQDQEENLNEYLNDELNTNYQVVENVYSVIPDFDSYSPDEKKIAEYLDLETIIKDSKRKLEMANRDLFNLRYMPDTESILSARDEIYNRIEKIKDETPLSIISKKKVNFVKYVEDEELDKYFEEYLNLKNINLDKSSKKRLLEQNKLLNKKATIETNAYNVEIKYISGRIEEITLIVRNIDSEIISDVNFIEFIPKEIIDTTDNIVFIAKDYSIIQKDPVFEYDLKKTNEVIYYLKDSTELGELPKIKSVLITTRLDDNNKITGFALLDNLGFTEQNKKIFIIELIVVFILLGIYLYYYFTNNETLISVKSTNQLLNNNITNNKNNISVNKIGNKNIKEINEFNEYTKDMSKYYSKTKLKDITNLKDISNQDINNDLILEVRSKKIINPEKINYIISLIKNAKIDIKNQNYKEAALKYHEIKFIYDLLDNNDKKIIYTNLREILDKITIYNINDLYENALFELTQGNIEKSLDYYNEIKEEYEKLTNIAKENIYGKCCELALLIKNSKYN